jgi:hypothetical protein
VIPLKAYLSAFRPICAVVRVPRTTEHFPVMVREASERRVNHGGRMSSLHPIGLHSDQSILRRGSCPHEPLSNINFLTDIGLCIKLTLNNCKFILRIASHGAFLILSFFPLLNQKLTMHGKVHTQPTTLDYYYFFDAATVY